MNMFYCGIILSGVWAAAAWSAKSEAGVIICNVFSFVWLALAIIYKVVV